MAGNSTLRHALHMAIGPAIVSQLQWTDTAMEIATMNAVDAVLGVLQASGVEGLVEIGALEHVGWQSQHHDDESTHPFVHKHFFDSWSDEIIAHHVNCNPVFVRKDR